LGARPAPRYYQEHYGASLRVFQIGAEPIPTYRSAHETNSGF
jgi:hypothetical protein